MVDSRQELGTLLLTLFPSCRVDSPHMELHYEWHWWARTLLRYPNTLLPEPLSSMELPYLRCSLWVVSATNSNKIMSRLFHVHKRRALRRTLRYLSSCACVKTRTMYSYRYHCSNNYFHGPCARTPEAHHGKSYLWYARCTLRPLPMQSETRIEKAGFRSVYFSDWIVNSYPSYFVRRIEYTDFLYFFFWRRLMQDKGVPSTRRLTVNNNNNSLKEKRYGGQAEAGSKLLSP